TNALSELYARPAGLGALEARPASAANLAPGAPPEIADDEVLVPCGWGGPYLRLPAGDDRLRDPWGNPFENPDAAGLSRLLDAAGNPATATNTCVAAIRHFGADAMDDAARPPASATQRDGSRAFETGTGALLLTFEPGSVSKFRWYQPAGDKITGASTNVAPAASQAVADGISPGIRFAKVFFSNGSSRVIQFKIQPGRVTPIAL
ncbi:MAG: hypothetical protein IJP66_02845, partial [Kiritimatiellae bacterium]|nr:hypothetical protein [Kiritimatiellia bacterium]